MGEIVKEIIVCGTKKCDDVPALFDSGIKKCVISKEFAEYIGVKETGFIDVGTINHTPQKKQEVELKNVKIKGKERPAPRALISDKIPYDFIVGRDVMQDLGIKLNLREKKLEFGSENVELSYNLWKWGLNKEREPLKNASRT